MAGLTTFQTWKERISAFELEEKCKATYGSTKIGEDGKVTMEEHFGPCLRSMRSYIAERALRCSATWPGCSVTNFRATCSPLGSTTKRRAAAPRKSDCGRRTAEPRSSNSMVLKNPCIAASLLVFGNSKRYN